MIRRQNKKVYFSIFIAILPTLIVIVAWPSKKTTSSVASGQLNTKASTTGTSDFNKDEYPLNQALSLWVVVNKGRILPADYAPANLVAPNIPLRLSSSSLEMHVRTDMAQALETMFSVAKADGIQLMLASGYRSYADQQTVYSGYASRFGIGQADTFSARPGHSEHQTGLAADIEPVSRNCELDQCFADTPEGRWLAVNTYKYGLITRYQKSTESITGYEYEPWHLRYVGAPLAQRLNSNGQTMEQFFNLPIYTTYPDNNYEISDL